MTTFRLKTAEELRESITSQTQRNILKLYEEMYRQIVREINRAGENLTKERLVMLQRTIKSRIETINSAAQSEIVSASNSVCEEVVANKKDWLRQYGLKETDLEYAFAYVPNRVVQTIAAGTIYQEGWRLSSAIWGADKKVQDAIDRIVSIGTAQGKSTYDIAKDIEKYVQPGARKMSRTISSWRYDRNGNKIRDTFYFGRVDYNAQRLARTMISHAYQQAFETVNRNDPFVEYYIWHTSNFHGRVCDICRARDGQKFKKDELPLDHPNGMCTFEAYSPYTMKEIAQKIGAWYESPVGTYPEIDLFAQDFGYRSKI